TTRSAAGECAMEAGVVRGYPRCSETDAPNRFATRSPRLRFSGAVASSVLTVGEKTKGRQFDNRRPSQGRKRALTGHGQQYGPDPLAIRFQTNRTISAPAAR